MFFVKLVCPGSASNLLAGSLNNCFGGSGGEFLVGLGFFGFFSELSRIMKTGFLLSMNTKSTNFFFPRPK